MASKLFSYRKRPVHLGPYPLERLRRQRDLPDLSRVPPMQALSFDDEQNNESLNHAMARFIGMFDAIRDGAVQRVRPKAMTVAVILAGLVPIVFSSGTGAEVMQRIAAPMLGGMITAPLLSMLVIPAVWLLMRRRTMAPRFAGTPTPGTLPA